MGTTHLISSHRLTIITSPGNGGGDEPTFRTPYPCCLPMCFSRNGLPRKSFEQSSTAQHRNRSSSSCEREGGGEWGGDGWGGDGSGKRAVRAMRDLEGWERRRRRTKKNEEERGRRTKTEEKTGKTEERLPGSKFKTRLPRPALPQIQPPQRKKTSKEGRYLQHGAFQQLLASRLDVVVRNFRCCRKHGGGGGGGRGIELELENLSIQAPHSRSHDK